MHVVSGGLAAYLTPDVFEIFEELFFCGWCIDEGIEMGGFAGVGPGLEVAEDEGGGVLAMGEVVGLFEVFGV